MDVGNVLQWAVDESIIAAFDNGHHTIRTTSQEFLAHSRLL
jgi:hypothetical protein